MIEILGDVKDVYAERKKGYMVKIVRDWIQGNFYQQ